MKNAWLVRPFSHGTKRLQEFRAQNIIAVGWPGIGDLSNKSRENIKESISRKPYNLNGLALGNAYNLLYLLYVCYPTFYLFRLKKHLCRCFYATLR
jgi:hypothetical protein